MPWTEERITEYFSRVMLKERLGHAYLFVGPAGIGKARSALSVAKMVNCEGAPAQGAVFCGKCSACLKIDSGSHPDVVLVEPDEGQRIKIDRIRELINRSQLRSFEARKKVFIIQDIELLTIEGSNALLKTLEEPGPDTLLFLTTSVPEKNLDTIKSRCQQLRFFPLSKECLKERLICDDGLSREEAHFLACFSEGYMGKARKLKQEDFFSRKNDIVDNVVLRRDNEGYMKKALADKQQVRAILEVLLYWFRDLALVKQGVREEGVAHRDRFKDLSESAACYTFEQLWECLRVIVATARMLGDNLNIKIPVAILREKIWVRS